MQNTERCTLVLPFHGTGRLPGGRPSELLESPVLGEHLPEVLSPAEVDVLEDSIDLSKWEGQRNRAIIEVLFSCGLRVSELVNLKLSNIYVDEQYVRVFGKGSKERLVPISPKALRELDKWFIDRNLMKIKPGEEDYVFLNRRGAHLTRTMILIMIKEQAVVAGIQRPSLPIPCAIPSPPLSSKAVLTCVPSRRCWDMSQSVRRRYIPISTCQRSVRRSWSIIRGI